MKRVETALPGVVILEPRVFADERGFFFEAYNQKTFADLGIRDEFVQDNHSTSVRGTIRGLHYQVGHLQSKLCRVVEGAVLDVAVDIRRGSPHFGRWTAVELSADNRRLLYIPRGFAHGFAALTERCTLLYKCDGFYVPEADRGIAWDDPQLAIPWGIGATPILSPKDRALPRLADIEPNELPEFTEK